MEEAQEEDEQEETREDATTISTLQMEACCLAPWVTGDDIREAAGAAR